MEPQNKNNACVTGDAKRSSAPPPSQTERRLWSQGDVTKRNQESKETKLRTSSQANCSGNLQKHSERKTHLSESTARSSQEKKPVILPSSQTSLSAGYDYQNPPGSPFSPHSAITHNVASRFGMKTFTVVPPRPNVSCNTAEVPPHAATVAAVKIDDQGNMVRTGIGRNKSGPSRSESVNETSGFGRAREFWSSSKKQEKHSRGQVERDIPVGSSSANKLDAQSNIMRAGVGYSRAGTHQVESSNGSPQLGRAREFWSSSEKQDSQSRGLVERDVPVRSSSTIKIEDQSNVVWASVEHCRAETQVESNNWSPQLGRAREFWSSSEKQECHSRGLIDGDVPVRSPSLAAPEALSLGTRPDDQTVRRAQNETLRNFLVDRDELAEETRKNLTFLKPSRRTSSHYVASAINKHSQTNASSRPSYTTQKSNSSIASSQSTTSQRLGRAATVDPKPSAASLNVSSTKQSESSLLSAQPAAPSRSLSYPELHRSDSRSDSQSEAVEVQALREKFGGGRGSSGGISKMLQSAKTRHLQSSWVDRVNATAAANEDRDAVELSPRQIPKPAVSSSPPPKKTPSDLTIVSPKFQNNHIYRVSRNNHKPEDL